MLRNALFQVHWFVGITAGVVLAVVGATGAILSFEPEILHALNRDVRVAGVGAQPPLAPPGLLAALQEAEPDRRLNSLAVWRDPARAPRVTLAAVESADGKAPGGRPAQGGPPQRGEVRFLDPGPGPSWRPRAIAARLLPHHAFGASLADDRPAWQPGPRPADRRRVHAVARVPCRVRSLPALAARARAQLARVAYLQPALQGPRVPLAPALRHRDLGPVLYLVMALTGLYWSYEWYKDGLYALTGAEPQRTRAEGGAAPASDRSTAARWDRASLEAAWAGFHNEVGERGYEMAVIELPPVASPTLSIRYLDVDPPHERAYNSLELDTTGTVLSHRRFADRPAGDRFMASIFPLHSGRYFGIAGVVLFMLASLAMPLFAVTGWMLYLARRRLKKRGQVSLPGQARLDGAIQGRSAMLETPGDA